MFELERLKLVEVEQAIKLEDRLYCICTLNAQHLHLIYQNEMRFPGLYNLDFTIDSRWISKIVARYTRYKLDVHTGCDILLDLVSDSKVRGKKIFFLGASEESNKLARQKYEENTGRIAFGASPNKDVLRSDAYVKNLCVKLNDQRIDYLILGFGAPHQEIFMSRYRELMEQTTSLKVVLGCGAAIDFYSGVQKRCPKWVNRIGLEIFFRFITEMSVIRAKRIADSAVGLLKFRAALTSVD